MTLKLSMKEMGKAMEEYLTRRGFNLQPINSEGHTILFHYDPNDHSGPYTASAKVQSPEPKDGPYR